MERKFSQILRKPVIDENDMLQKFLSLDVLKYLLSNFCDYQTVTRLSSVSLFYFKFARSDEIWKELYTQDISNELVPSKTKTYLQLYVEAFDIGYFTNCGIGIKISTDPRTIISKTEKNFGYQSAITKVIQSGIWQFNFTDIKGNYIAVGIASDKITSLDLNSEKAYSTPGCTVFYNTGIIHPNRISINCPWGDFISLIWNSKTKQAIYITNQKSFYTFPTTPYEDCKDFKVVIMESRYNQLCCIKLSNFRRISETEFQTALDKASRPKPNKY